MPGMCAQSLCCVQLFVKPRTVASQAPLSMEFSRQECWSGLSFPPPGDLPNPGTEPMSITYFALTGVFFTTGLPGKPIYDAIGSCKVTKSGCITS